ncbi:MAG TPA: IS110 family transposase [Firmicutes bacterium]|nr:IS110 family transposase [Bacillota bacterium]
MEGGYARARNMDQVRLLLKVPGLDVISIMTILSEVGDVSRFPSPKKLCSYAGLVPRVHFSGKTRYTGSITRAGRSNLRWIMVQVAHQAVKVPGSLQSFYLRLKAKKGTKVAIVAVARKLLAIIWMLLTRNEEYREPRARYNAKLRKMDRLARPYAEAISDEVNAALTKFLQEEARSTPVGVHRACTFSPMMTAQHRRRLISALLM